MWIYTGIFHFQLLVSTTLVKYLFSFIANHFVLYSTSEVSQDAVEISDTEVSSQANSVHTLNFPDDIGNPLILTCSSSDEGIEIH